MDTFDVVRDENGFLVQIASDRRMPIMRDGQPGAFHPGWTPMVVTGGGGINILELQHESGHRAIWYLDEQFSFIGNNFESLGDTARGFAVDAARAIKQSIWLELGCATKPALRPELVQRLRVLEAAGLPAELEQDTWIEAAAVGCLDDGSCAAVASALAGHVPNVAASIGFLHQMMARDFFKDLVGASATGKVQAISPIDGQHLRTDVGFCLRRETIAYRFSDHAHDLTFYLIGSLWRVTLAAIYIPRFDLIVHANALDQRHLGEFLGEPVDRAIYRHVMNHAEEIIPYLDAPIRMMTLLYSQNHLGHHLFNELGGLHEIVARIPPDRIPEILLPNAYHSEMYGKLDELFTELTGKVDRAGRNPEQIRQFAYINARCLLRPTDDYVPAGLAKRIIALNEQAASLDADKALFSRLSVSGFMFVMLGLRVENRTVVDPVGFFAEVTDFLQQAAGKIAVVFDGHNSIAGQDGGRMYDSHMEGQASKAPAEVEADIVQAMRDRYSGNPNVAVISTVGAPMSASLYWCNRSAFFVTPWGAGLAKYRWVCNRPGLVVAGHHFLRHGGEKTIHLYDSDEFMENPTPLSFIAEDEVQDEPDAPLLVGILDENRVNFTVRPDALRARLVALVRGAAALQA